MQTEAQLKNLKTFSSTYQPKTRGNHRHSYFQPLLKRCLKKKYKFEDPETQEIGMITAAEGLMIKWIWEGLQGNEKAIKDIVDRIDGKVAEVIKEVKDDSDLMNDEIELIPNNGKHIPSRISKFISNQ